MHVIKFLVTLLFSPRLWVPLNLAAGLYLSLGYPLPPLVPLHWIVTGAIAIAAVAFAVTAMTVYNVTSVQAFVGDIMFDVLFLLLAVAMGSVVVTLSIVSNWSLLGLTFIGIGAVLAITDLAVSLYGGASKLLEMDKVRTSSLSGGRD